MDIASSVYDLSKKITVLDAIFWVKAAIKEIKKSTVSNCFKKCGFPISQDEEILVDVDSNEEIQNLINFSWGAHFLAGDYINIDQGLQTETSSIDLSELVRQTRAEEDEISDEEVEEPRGILTVSPTEIDKCFEKLRHYFLDNKDAHGLEKTANLQMHFENVQSQKRKKQKSITDYMYSK